MANRVHTQHTHTHVHTDRQHRPHTTRLCVGSIINHQCRCTSCGAAAGETTCLSVLPFKRLCVFILCSAFLCFLLVVRVPADPKRTHLLLLLSLLLQPGFFPEFFHCLYKANHVGCPRSSGDGACRPSGVVVVVSTTVATSWPFRPFPSTIANPPPHVVVIERTAFDDAAAVAVGENPSSVERW